MIYADNAELINGIIKFACTMAILFALIGWGTK
jgi:hypothetical protein